MLLFSHRLLIDHNPGCGPTRRPIRQRKPPIVEALAQQHYIRDGIVDSQYCHGGKHALEDGAEYVGDIAKEPDDNELEGEAVGGGAPKVLDDLGGEDYDPASYGD